MSKKYDNLAKQFIKYIEQKTEFEGIVPICLNIGILIFTIWMITSEINCSSDKGKLSNEGEPYIGFQLNYE